jgi:hypothetical protein
MESGLALVSPLAVVVRSAAPRIEGEPWLLLIPLAVAVLWLLVIEFCLKAGGDRTPPRYREGEPR